MQQGNKDETGKRDGVLGTIAEFATLVVLWFVLGVPLATGIRSMVRAGVVADAMSFAAFAGIFIGSFWAYNQLSRFAWGSNELRRSTYFWLYFLIWGSALVLFSPWFANRDAVYS